MGWLKTVAVTGTVLAVSGALARTADVPAMTERSLGSDATVGVKTSWLRADLTADYATPVKYQGSVALAGDATVKIRPTMTLANGYLDLGTWYRVALESR